MIVAAGPENFAGRVVLGLLRQSARAAFEEKVDTSFTWGEVAAGLFAPKTVGIEKTPPRFSTYHQRLQKFNQLGSARLATIWFRESRSCSQASKAALPGEAIFLGKRRSGTPIATSQAAK
jgi:hypothetical protein